MFYILSQSVLEASTDSVCQWLEYLTVPFYRINGEDLIAFPKR